MRPWLKRLSRNRLIHYMGLGAILFALAPRAARPHDIALDSQFFAALERAEAQRTGGAVDRAAVRARAVEDEILYREAQRLGLVRADTIVRQRLIQKVLFLAEDLAGGSQPPTDAQLRAFFEQTRAQWKRPPQVRFHHVFVRADHRDQLPGLRVRWLATPQLEAPPSLGDAFALARTAQLSQGELARAYGASFAGAVFSLAPGAISAPIESKFGWHLVRVLERFEASPAAFDDVKGELPHAYLLSRKKRAVANFVDQAQRRYRITVDGRPMGPWQPTERLVPERTAMRAD